MALANGASPRRILYIAPDDPWDWWTNSGFSRMLCQHLRARGLLWGALSRHATSRAGLHGPIPLARLWRSVARRLGKGPRRLFWDDESEGVIGQVLRELPPDTPVIYQYIFPKIDRSLPIKRYLFQDITVRDAVRTAAYGHGQMSPEQVEQKVAAQKRAIEEADGVLTFSTYAAESICNDYGYPPERVAAIGCGPVRAPSRATEPSLARYSASRILFAGRDWQRKGGPILLEAYRIVRSRMPASTLTIIGPSTPPADEPGVRFLGLVSNRRLRQEFAEASLFCMPSVCETWGIVYIDAAQAGLPVAGFRQWALPDIVADGNTGRLTDDATPEGLARVLLELLSDPQRMLQMGRAARQRVRCVLDWRHVIDRLLAPIMPEQLGARAPARMR